MATYQMALMGGAAAGSLVWGQVAGLTDVRTAVLAAAAYGLVVWGATRKLTVEGSAEIDFTPVSGPEQPDPVIPIDPQEGPVMVTIEYRIDPAQAAAFVEVMERTHAVPDCVRAPCHGACSKTPRTLGGMWNTSLTKIGWSTSGDCSASRPLMPSCEMNG